MNDLEIKIANRYLMEAEEGDSKEEDVPEDEVVDDTASDEEKDVPEDKGEPEPKTGIDGSDIKEKADDVSRILDDLSKAVKALRDSKHDPKSKDAEVLEQAYKKIGSLYSTYFQFS